jgi:hypothetical protein
VSFQPDIVVAEPDAGLRLVVEVKLGTVDVPAAEGQLARFMLGMRCPLGMIVTLDDMRLYRDTFASTDESSIELVGAFATPASLVRRVSRTDPPAEGARRFEDAVQEWLEDLTRLDRGELDAPARRLVEEHIIPALLGGEVRAGYARWRRTGS